MNQALRPPPWPEYFMEGALLGMFMVSACGFTALLEHPSSPVRAVLVDGDLRRALTGIAMGLTAIALIYSPWGKRSGAHMNPAVTLAFLRRGKVRPRDAAGYITAQFAGGLAGVLLARALLGAALSDPAVNFAVTVPRPGPSGAATAFVAELLLAMGMITLVLRASASARWGRRTGLLAGGLVALYITLEAPLSGMSMNPARTLASAWPASTWTGIWIYFTAPVLGMLGAEAAHRRLARATAGGCAKLDHSPRHRCIFCGYEPPMPKPGAHSASKASMRAA